MSVSDRLAAYWPFNSTHAASVTDEYAGSLTLDGGTAGTAAGKVREALSLTRSSSEFRSRSDDASLRQLKGCLVWVKLTTKANDMVILSKGSSVAADDQSIKLWYDTSDDEFKYTVGDDTTSTTVASTGLTIATGTWYCIRCAADGERQTIWVNGTLYGSAAYRAPLSETGILYIGRDTSGDYFDGLIDELAVFSTAPTRADGAIWYNGGDGLSLPEFDSLPGSSGRGGFHNSWDPPSFAESDDGVLYVAHGKRRVQAFDGYGGFRSAGVPTPGNDKPTLASSGTGRIVGDLYGYVRFLDADGRVSSMSKISNVLKASGDSRGAITGATNAAPIVITSASHGLTTGTRIRITGQLGNTAVNRFWYITVVDTDTFSLDGSVGNGDWIASASPSLNITERQAGRAAVNEVHTLSYAATPSGGTFTLSYDGEVTTDIAYNASAATIQTALEVLGTVGDSNVACAGGTIDTTAVTITFQGDLAGTDVPLIVTDNTNTSGASVTVSIATLVEGDPGTDEVQTLDLYGTPTGGTFTLTFDGQTTAAIAYNAAASAVDSALEALSNIGAGDVACTGGPLPGSTVTITFGGALADTNVAEITADPDSLTGGSISVSVAETTPGAPNLGANLQHFWKMDETSSPWYDSVASADLSGSGSSVSGKISNALSHVGTIGPTGSATLDSSSDFSVCLWAKLSSVGIASGSLFYADDPDAAKANLFTIAYSHVLNRFQVLVANSAGTGSVFASADTFGAPSAHTWYFIVLTYDDSSGTVGISVNGGAEDTATGAGGRPSQSYTLTAQTGTLSLGAHIDEVGYFSKKLTSGEITSLYNSGSGRTYPLPSGADEVQTITIAGSPTAGTFDLTYGGQTATINYDDTAAEVDTALEALSSIGSGNVSCGGGPLPGTAVTVTFQGDLAKTDVALMTVDDDLMQYGITTTTDGSPDRNEQQRVSASPTPIAGTFTLTHSGNTTSALDYDATAAEVQTELEGLASIGSGNVSCTGGPINSASIVAEFQGALASTNTAEMTAASSLTGAVPDLDIAETTKGLDQRNEIQEVTVVDVTSGTFTLTYGGQTTSALEFDATASDIETALEELSTIDSVAVTGGPLTEGVVSVEFQGTLAATDVALMTGDESSLYNGGWAVGASEIEYTDVAVPTDTRVVRKQILRTKPGTADVAYIDVDTTDIDKTIFTSTKTDDDLDPTTLIVLIDADGVDNNLERHGEPPNWMAWISSFQNRLFGSNSYEESAGAVQVDGTDADGAATDWPAIFDGRTLSAEDASDSYVIDTMDADDQITTLTDNGETSTTTGPYTIAYAEPEGQRIYHSWVTALDAFPESFYPSAPFQITRDARDGKHVGTFSFDGRLFAAFQNTIYRYSYDVDPAQAPTGDGAAYVAVPRGLVNVHCVAYTDDYVFCLDHQGVFQFDGNSVDGTISQNLKPIFTGENSDTKIHWQHAKNFHASYFAADRIVRFFVSLDGGRLPKHALCLNVDSSAWWIEEYPYRIGASHPALIDGEFKVLLGAEYRQIFTLSGTQEGARNETSTLRGTATSATAASISDSGATFGSGLVGLPIDIVSGTGRGQSAIIRSVSGTRLFIVGRWKIRPDTTSVYQIAGVRWSIRTGKLRLTSKSMPDNTPRGVEVIWTPVDNDQILEAKVSQDFKSTAEKNRITISGGVNNGFSIEDGSEYQDANMGDDDVGGTATFRLGEIPFPDTSAPVLIDIEAGGVTNDERHELHAIAVRGAS